MVNIKRVKDNFFHNLEEIDQINTFGDEVIGLTIDYLEDLRRQNEGLGGFAPYKQKLDNTINQIRRLKSNAILEKKYEIIFNQSIVLIISSFEIFINEFLSEVANSAPEVIKWNQKEKISINPIDFDHSNFSFGKIVVKHFRQKYSFQDIQSILRLFSEVFSFNLKISDNDLDDLILYQASRNIIVHNLAKIDQDFLNQIRLTKYYIKYFAHSGKLELKKDNYDKAKLVYKKLADLMIFNLREQLINMYEFDILEDNTSAIIK